MPLSGDIALKSFQSFQMNDGLLAKVVEAVKAGEKEARTTGDIQTFEVFYKGFRQNIAIGRVMVIPAKVADSRDTFPIALLYGCLIREFGGEEMADLLNFKIGDNEFDEYSKADLAALKDKIFKNSEGKFESLVLFAPAWWNKREYITFKFDKDDEQLSNKIRHLVFSAYFDPRLSSAFNALMTDPSTDRLDVTNVTPKLNFPGIAENPLKDYPDMQKLGAGRKKIFLTVKTADAITKQQLEPAELNVFEALNTVVERALGVEPMKDVATHKASDENEQKQPSGAGLGNIIQPAMEAIEEAGPELLALASAKCKGCGTEQKDLTRGYCDSCATERADKKTACGELPVVDGTNVGIGAKKQELQAPKAPEKAPEGKEPIGIELNDNGTAKREEKGKEAAKKTAGTISFANKDQVLIYKGFLTGQMSDGTWENSGPRDHWRPMNQADVVVGTPGMDFIPRRTYDYVRTLPYIGEEALYVVKASHAYPNLSLEQMERLSGAIGYVCSTGPENLSKDWEQKYAQQILEATGETDINQFVAKVKGQPYSERDLLKDVRAIKAVINGKFNEANMQFRANVQKQARDLNEVAEYNGHTLRLTTWQERDRFNVNLVDETEGDRDILNLWDEDAHSAFEDGFLNVRDVIGSAIEYAEHLGLLKYIGEEENVNASLVNASSEASRKAAQKNAERLKKSYESRKFADEVPTADNVLNEVLTDMGPAPGIDLPDMPSNPNIDNSTTTEAQVPAEMKSNEPEETKAEAKPEDAGKPWESKSARRKISDIMDLLEGSSRFGMGSRYGAAVAEDIAEAKTEITFNKADMVDNKDADQGSPSSHFANDDTDGTEDWNERGRQEEAQRERKKKQGGERNDDVPFSQGETEGGKQPTSDLSGPAPEKHDVDAQVDSKVADADFYAPEMQVFDNGGQSMDRYTIIFLDQEQAPGTYSAIAAGSDVASPQGFYQHTEAQPGEHLGKEITFQQLPQALRDRVNEELKQNYPGDPLENAPGYREHSNAMNQDHELTDEEVEQLLSEYHTYTR